MIDAGKVAFLAGQFADVVHEWTTPEQFEEIKRLNRTDYAGTDICATHDFFDANEAMDAAFKRAFGRGCILPSDVEEGRASDADETADIELWNAAWKQAKEGWLS